MLQRWNKRSALAAHSTSCLRTDISLYLLWIKRSLFSVSSSPPIMPNLFFFHNSVTLEASFTKCQQLGSFKEHFPPKGACCSEHHSCRISSLSMAGQQLFGFHKQVFTLQDLFGYSRKSLHCYSWKTFHHSDFYSQHLHRHYGRHHHHH